MQASFISKSHNETLKFGIELGKLLKPGDIVCLDGELGAGKTVLTKGIAKGLGIGKEVTSPTYTLINEYPGKVSLYHFDLYRLEDEDELFHIGGEELLYGQGVSVIEWASRAKDLLYRDCIWIRLGKPEGRESARLIELTVLEERRELFTLVERFRCL